MTKINSLEIQLDKTPPQTGKNGGEASNKASKEEEVLNVLCKCVIMRLEFGMTSFRSEKISFQLQFRWKFLIFCQKNFTVLLLSNTSKVLQ